MNDVKLVLSLFPGADLLGMAFEQEGFCVVQGPDVIFGRDVRRTPEIFLSRSAVRERKSPPTRGACESYWIAYYEAGEMAGARYTQQSAERLSWWSTLAKSCFWWWPKQNFTIVSDRPATHWDERFRLHRHDGPAVHFADDYSLYAVHGVRIPWEKRHIVESPTKIQTSEIDDEKNAEIRRVMIDRFGAGNYLQATNTKAAHSDDFGTLYRRQIPGDEDLVIVKVINSTPEPDGSRKDYWIRVAPDIKSAHEAVAWTFGMSTKEYVPEMET